MKKRYLVSIVFFLLPLVFFFICSIVDTDRTFSEAENRELALFPEFTPEKYADASFMQEFEKYYNDQFPLRDEFLKFAKVYDSIMFPSFLLSEDDIIGSLPSSCVIYKGRIMETFRASMEGAERYANIVNILYEECGKPATYLLVPPPSYNLYIPNDKIGEENNFAKSLEALAGALNGPKLIDLGDVFEKNKYEYIYFNTDHHWTARGAYFACNEFLKTAEGTSLPSIDEYAFGAREGFLGSLYKFVMNEKAGTILEKNPDTVEYFYPLAAADINVYQTAEMTEPQKREVLYPDYNADSNLYSIYMGGDIPLGHIKTETKNGKSILVVRDSYGHAFVPFLIDAYEEIYTVEPRYFTEGTNKLELGKFFKEHEIDTLLFLGYPHMVSGIYWDATANYLEQIVNTDTKQ